MKHSIKFQSVIVCLVMFVLGLGALHVKGPVEVTLAEPVPMGDAASHSKGNPAE